MADLYDTLSASDQASFRARLFAHVSQQSCPTVDLSGIASAEQLVDAGNRAMAVDCFQETMNLPAAGGAGVVDQTTLAAIQSAGAVPFWEKAALVLAGTFVFLQLAKSMRRGKRRRR
jgi:hypothetical protein